MSHKCTPTFRWLSPLLLVAGGGLAHGATPLGQYDVDPSTVTVAGISSGGFMAVQMEVAYSSHFHGAAIFAGGPFYCAQGSESTATGACESGSGISVSGLVTYTEIQADAGTIDDPSHLTGQPIYLFSGTQDTTVHQATMDALQQYFETWVSSSDINYNNSTAAAHGWISPDGPNSCGTSYSPYINNCSIDPEQTFLSQFYGSLSAKTTGTLGGSLIQFDQTPFCGSGGCNAISMDTTGWAFVPQSCAGGATCKLVLALHGCAQYQGVVGQDFVKDSGLNEWADSNDVIVIYPQTIAGTGNPEGCWDWFGYTGTNYALRSGPQMQALMGMVTQAGAAYPNGQVTTSATAASSSSGSTSAGTTTSSSTTGSSGACVGLGLSCASNSNCCQGLAAGLVVTCESGNLLCLPSVGSGTTTASTTSSGGATSSSTSSATTGSGSGSTAAASSSSGAGSSGATTSSTPGLSISSVLPKSATVGSAASLVIEGTGFASGDQVTVGTELVTGLSIQSASVISGTLAAELGVGTYDVTVITPDGAQAVLKSSFQVTVAAKSGCASTDGLPFGGLLVLLLVRRRARSL